MIWVLYMSRYMYAYAESFVSFLMQNLEEKYFLNIKDIILFGSTARNKADKTSDVDIFINIYKDSKEFEKRISLILKKFYNSELFNRYWKLMGIENEIRCISGELNKWKDLKSSIIANGISLYSKYNSILKGKTNVLIYWDKIKPESKRILLSKKIYGYTYKNKEYKGLLEKTNTLKLGSNCLLIPLEDSGKFFDIFKSLKIPNKKIYVSRVE